MLRVIEGGRRQESGDDIVEMLTPLSTPQLRELLARVRAYWPMHRRSPEQHAFMLSFAEWIEEHAPTC